MRIAAVNVADGRTPSLPWLPLCARYSTHSCRSVNSRYPPNCPVRGPGPLGPQYVDSGRPLSVDSGQPILIGLELVVDVAQLGFPSETRQRRNFFRGYRRAFRPGSSVIGFWPLSTRASHYGILTSCATHC